MQIRIYFLSITLVIYTIFIFFYLLELASILPQLISDFCAISASRLGDFDRKSWLLASVWHLLINIFVFPLLKLLELAEISSYLKTHLFNDNKDMVIQLIDYYYHSNKVFQLYFFSKLYFNTIKLQFCILEEDLNEKIIELKTELSEDQLRFHSLELRVKKIFLECFFIFTYLIIILLFYFYFKSETSNLEYCIRVIGWYELDSDYRLRYGGANYR